MVQVCWNERREGIGLHGRNGKWNFRLAVEWLGLRMYIHGVGWSFPIQLTFIFHPCLHMGSSSMCYPPPPCAPCRPWARWPTPPWRAGGPHSCRRGSSGRRRAQRCCSWRSNGHTCRRTCTWTCSHWWRIWRWSSQSRSCSHSTLRRGEGVGVLRPGYRVTGLTLVRTLKYPSWFDWTQSLTGGGQTSN